MGMFVCPIGFLFVPVILLLSLSFFILVALANVKTHTLKVFGYVIVTLIWVTTILVFAGGIYKASKGMYPGMHMKKATMKYPMLDKLQSGEYSELMVCPKK